MRTRAIGSSFLTRQGATAACLVCFLAVTWGDAVAQSKRFRPQPNYVQLGEPDALEGRRSLEDFRQRSLAGDFYLEFDLRVMPRRGDEYSIPVRMWGGKTERGPISRIEIPATEKLPASRLLVQNGPESAAWSWHSGAGDAVTPLGAMLFERLGGTDLTAFDLQMPYIYWSDYVFEGVTNRRNRPSHVFLMYPPAAITAVRPEITGVRMYVDTAYHALVQSELIGAEGRVLKTMTLGSIQKVDEQYMIKAIDLIDERTRDKTGFRLTAAALGIDLPATTFAPAALVDAGPVIPAGRLRKLGR